MRLKSRAVSLPGIALAVMLLAAGCGSGSTDADPPVNGSGGVAASSPGSAVLDEWRAGMAGMWNISDPPAVPVVEYVAPEEAERYTTRCMVEKGYVKDSSNAYTVLDEQKTVFDMAMYECAVSYPPDPRMLKPYSQDQLTLIYQHNEKSVIPCLEQHGFTIPESPSLETFIQTFESQPFIPFDSAYLQGPGLGFSDMEVEELRVVCPPYPPAELLWAG